MSHIALGGVRGLFLWRRLRAGHSSLEFWWLTSYQNKGLAMNPLPPFRRALFFGRAKKTPSKWRYSGSEEVLYFLFVDERLENSLDDKLILFRQCWNKSHIVGKLRI